MRAGVVPDVEAEVGVPSTGRHAEFRAPRPFPGGFAYGDLSRAELRTLKPGLCAGPARTRCAVRTRVSDMSGQSLPAARAPNSERLRLLPSSRETRQFSTIRPWVRAGVGSGRNLARAHGGVTEEGTRKRVLLGRSEEELGCTPGESKSSRAARDIQDELLVKFRRHHEGPEPSRKLRDNVTSKIYRIRAFVAYMGEGKSRLATLRFMDDPERMRTWVTNLRASKMTETTLNHYLNNVAQFLDYVHETPPPTSRLSKKSMLGIRREVRALLKCLRRGVVMHQIGVKQAKEGRVIPKVVLRRCLSEAKKRIPEVLDQLENDLQQKTQFSFYGYLTAYYASIYGHRLGVFQNLTIREV
ncbi:uncharacterized protein [Misgurnus anguillicaudatus]|uniref:uncharacterized protein n=1 Tax=Misgurnus anguillicaudatus TaxID=75329 RepID=UPI003CCFA2D8